MQIGLQIFLWTHAWRRDDVALVARAANLGFDCIQIPILDLEGFDADTTLAACNDAGLDCYLSAGLKAHSDITSDDAAVRAAGVDFLTRCVDLAAQMGCPFLSGSFHSEFAVKPKPLPTDDNWRYAAESLAKVADVAAAAGLKLLLEPINRYESNLINTGAQAARLARMTGRDNFGVQLDTFHMTLEEDSLPGAIRDAGAALGHLHVAESHRGVCGTGSVDWDGVFAALRAIDYQGAAVFESFFPDVEPVARATCVWRETAASSDELAAQSLAFLRQKAAEHGL